MKKLFIFSALMAMVAIGFTACTKSELTQAGNSNGKSVTINASITEPPTRVVFKEEDSKLNMYWSDVAGNDKFSLHFTGEASPMSYIFTKSAATTSAQVASFTCTSTPSISSGKDIYAVYPGSSDNASDRQIINFSLVGQSGAFKNDDNLGNYNFMVAKTQVPTSGIANAHFHFEHKLALVKLILTFPSNATGFVSNFTINASNIHNQGSFNLTTDSWTHTNAQLGSVTTSGSGVGYAFSGTSKTITTMLAVFPESIRYVSITAKAGDNNYIVDMPDVTFDPSKVYKVTKNLRLLTNLRSEYTGKLFYLWDAYWPQTYASTYYISGCGENYNNTPATASCKNSPTYDEIMTYLGAGVYYYDPARDGTGGPAYSTMTDPVKKARPGFWFKKKQYISNFSYPWATKESSIEITNAELFKTGCPPESEIDKYFFLPMLGYYKNYALKEVGSVGGYWSSTSSSATAAYSLKLTPTKVTVDNTSFSKSLYALLPMVLE